VAAVVAARKHLLAPRNRFRLRLLEHRAHQRQHQAVGQHHRAAAQEHHQAAVQEHHQAAVQEHHRAVALGHHLAADQVVLAAVADPVRIELTHDKG